ncbi:MAG: sigma-70 family RNA polymerase sigma factor [Planctomycetota bacterium]
MTATMTPSVLPPTPESADAPEPTADPPELPPLESLSDEALAARVQTGCVKSYEELDRRYRVRLLHLLRRRVGRETDAEDLAQVALWTAYEKIGRYDPKRKFSTWLFTIAVRKAIDHGRANAKHVAPAGHEPTAGGDAIIALPDQTDGPLAQTIAAEERDQNGAIWRIADEVLKPAQWTALWLHYGEDQTPGEVAKAMNITRVNARVLLHRARKILADKLGDASAITE